MNEEIKTKIKIVPYVSWADDREETISISLVEGPTLGSDIKWAQDNDPLQYDTFINLRMAVGQRVFLEGETLYLYIIKKEANVVLKEEIPIKVSKKMSTEIDLIAQMKKLGIL